MDEALRPVFLFFALLNPFLLSIYLLDLIQTLSLKVFIQVLIRGSLISGTVFSLFAWGGEAIFDAFLQVSFASFQIFGGVLFVIIGIQFVFQGAQSLQSLRGSAEHLGGSIAMPFMIGPGTVSASILIGSRNPPFVSTVAIFTSLAITILCLAGMKHLHDSLRGRQALLTSRYVDIVGRLSALLIGSIAIDMILRGLGSWLSSLKVG